MSRRSVVTVVWTVLAVGGSLTVGILLAQTPVAAGTSTTTTAPLDIAARQKLTEHGATLYEVNCATCHGPGGLGRTGPKGVTRGEAVGPSLVHVGAAAAYYQLSTGRMPLADVTGPPVRKPPVFDAADIAALVEYVASLGSGPALPDINTARGDLALGGETFRANCAPCHSAAGAGGALSYGDAAPSLHQATALQVGAAIRSGPGQMPRFGPQTISDAQADSLARYVEYLRQPQDRGGLSLGRTGPVPEGFVAWFLGIGGLLIVVFWIGTRAPWRGTDGDDPSEGSTRVGHGEEATR